MISRQGQGSCEKTREEIKGSLPDVSGIQVPDVAEDKLSEQIEILEHNNAEYERLINEMLMEIGMTEPKQP